MRLRNRGGMVQPETLCHDLRDFGQARLSSVVMESPVFPPIVSHVYQSPRWRPPRPLRPHSASAKVVVVEAGERRHGWAWTWVGLVRRVLRSRRLPEARLAAALLGLLGWSRRPRSRCSRCSGSGGPKASCRSSWCRGLTLRRRGDGDGRGREAASTRERDAHTINLNLALPSNSVDSFGTNTR